MVMSMTGFARWSHEASWGSLTWELKSVNHRFFEVNFRLPESFRLYEPKWKNILQRHIQRGKVECVLRYLPNADQVGELALNQALVKQLSTASEQVASWYQSPLNACHALDVLSWPGVVQAASVDAEAVLGDIEQQLDKATKQLLDMRATEGQTLFDFINQRVEQMAHIVSEVTSHMPAILAQQKDKVLQRFEELKVECDPDRLEQEMVWLMQKADVAEELHRLSAHLEEVRSILQKKGSIGRRLDFIMQELNREANTLASKSIDLGVTNASVDLKVLIEQMREQVQNIE